ncbi:hypothetical protein BLNAU_1737 [Blattamonas nauphoetae]|uniref:Uncharacterized protein n=1 Tax=Blattamonas nauphoetae TaxID=2049346 RepID=A0ABQ9YHG9_9EUKA|nr:hypothetical protein BLNAU_1737 [Blattamonas nauphoetae]
MIVCALISLVVMHDTSVRNAPKLIQVITTCRHGIRSNENMIPSLKCPTWNSAPAQITPLGAKQNYELGKHLSQKYSSLIGNTYNFKKHLIRSTNTNKCLSSAQDFAQGLFEQYATDYKTNHSIAWYAPIESDTFAIDYVMEGEQACNKQISTLRAPLRETEEFKTKLAESKAFFAEVTTEGGFTSGITLPTVGRAAEQIILLTGHGYTKDNNPFDGEKCFYENDETNNKLVQYATENNIMNNAPELVEISKLQNSPFINEVVSQMKLAFTKNSSREFIMYMGDNGNILGPVQWAKGKSHGRASFGGYFYFELYQMDDNTEGVKFGYYNLTTTVSPIDFSASFSYTDGEDLTKNICPGKEYCTFNDLVSTVYTNDEWMKVCGLVTEDEPVTTWPKAAIGTVIPLAVCLAVAVVAAIIFAICCCMRKPSGSKSGEMGNM